MVRGWKNIFLANGKQRKVGVALLISNKIDLKVKKITIDKEGHYIMIKRSIQEEDITIVNIYALNIRAPPTYIHTYIHTYTCYIHKTKANIHKRRN